MCLSNVSAEKIATEDIVCYKKLNCSTIDITALPECKSGDPFTALIRNHRIEGVIDKHTNEYGDIELFLCSNNSVADGQPAPDKHGCTYSWILDDAVTLLTINGITASQIYETVYQSAKVAIGKQYTSEIHVTKSCDITVGLHSCAELQSAKEISGNITVKCIIPKGAKYHTGTYKTDHDYASDTLKYVEIVTD